VIVVEDEGSISQFVCASLSAAGWLARAVRTLAGARAELAQAADVELVILDLGLPDGDGVDLVREIRSSGLALPILVLSARSAEDQKIAALDAGADDYLTKPFGVGELLARTRAMLRRAPPASPHLPLRIGSLEVDLQAREVRLEGERVKLSPREFSLLAALAAKAGKVMTHRQLLTEVWGPENVDQLQYLRIYMGHLRAKLESDPAQPRYLLTELGVGYRLASH
jgi:two-component system KDP operon response regulator KdpE